MLSCQSHGVALTICELGNGTWSVPFPDRAQALLRETVDCRPKVYRGGKTEGVASLLGSFHEGGKGNASQQNSKRKKGNTLEVSLQGISLLLDYQSTRL